MPRNFLNDRNVVRCAYHCENNCYEKRSQFEMCAYYCNLVLMNFLTTWWNLKSETNLRRSQVFFVKLFFVFESSTANPLRECFFNFWRNILMKRCIDCDSKWRRKTDRFARLSGRRVCWIVPFAIASMDRLIQKIDQNIDIQNFRKTALIIIINSIKIQ